MIRFENVGMRYGIGAEVLHDITFELRQGSLHFLTGASGAGKSTLLKLLYLAHRPSRGIITFDGKDVTTASRHELPKLRRQIGVVFQDFRLLSHMTAIENVMLPLRIAGAAEADVREHAEELLSWVGLTDSLNAKPSTLSGGEQQRLAIARAVIAKPKLLLADEPTGNVDPEMSKRLVHLFVELNRVGTTTVVATHESELVRIVKAPELRLEKGRLTRIEAGDGHSYAAPESGK
jgi:cell division transport system ATP-binding protein